MHAIFKVFRKKKTFQEIQKDLKYQSNAEKKNNLYPSLAFQSILLMRTLKVSAAADIALA